MQMNPSNVLNFQIAATQDPSRYTTLKSPPCIYERGYITMLNQCRLPAGTLFFTHRYISTRQLFSIIPLTKHRIFNKYTMKCAQNCSMANSLKKTFQHWFPQLMCIIYIFKAFCHASNINNKMLQKPFTYIIKLCKKFYLSHCHDNISIEHKDYFTYQVAVKPITSQIKNLHTKQKASSERPNGFLSKSVL